MAQYCEIAGKVTNCTENCRNCLEVGFGRSSSDKLKSKFRENGIC